MILWSVLAAILLAIGLIAYCYFNDNYCCVSDGDEDTVGCLCCKRQRATSYKVSKMNVTK